uniref:Putative LRR receptor-like serine/threonine-protein kinase n=1 Tax=Aegilops tauschii TaxID=37682 RepID=N1QW06_AEGTA
MATWTAVSAADTPLNDGYMWPSPLSGRAPWPSWCAPRMTKPTRQPCHSRCCSRSVSREWGGGGAPGADWNWLRIKVSGRPRDSAHGELRQLPLERLQVGARSQWSSGRGCVSSFWHPNLVRLIGCCVEGNNRLLVYEYAENNSLSNALLGPKSRCIPLNWQTRAAICTGTASGLAFLHEEAQPRIVHRDIKASNILLDKTLVPKIGDFGLAKLFPDAITHISTRVAGTMGYLAPEYALLGQLTKKADIYSFGVLLLEVISGESSSKSTWGEDMHVLVEWTWKLREEGRLLEIVDPDVEEYPEEQVLRFIKVALLCTQATAQQRPSMKQVVHMLANETEIDLQNAVPPGVLKEPRRKMGSLGDLALDTSSSQSTRVNAAGSCTTQTRDMNSCNFSTTEVSPR